MAIFQFEDRLVYCHIATVVDTAQAIVRISFIDNQDKAFGYIQYSFDEMPVVNQKGDLPDGTFHGH